MGAVLQLERFDQVDPPPPPPTHTAEDVQDAYARGVIAGRAEADAAQAEAVVAALSAVSRQLDDAGSRQAGRGALAADSLRPLIEALIDGVLPALARARLEAALLSRFAELAETVTPLNIRLRCGPDLAPFVTLCARQAGMTDAAIEADAPPGTVQAELRGGTICWDQAEVAAQLRTLVLETLEDH